MALRQGLGSGIVELAGYLQMVGGLKSLKGGLQIVIPITGRGARIAQIAEAGAGSSGGESRIEMSEIERIGFGVGVGLQLDGTLGCVRPNGDLEASLRVQGTGGVLAVDGQGILQAGAWLLPLIEKAQLKGADGAQLDVVVPHIGGRGFFALAERRNGHGVAREEHMRVAALAQCGIFRKAPEGLPEKAMGIGDAFHAVTRLHHITSLPQRRAIGAGSAPIRHTSFRLPDSRESYNRRFMTTYTVMKRLIAFVLMAAGAALAGEPKPDVKAAVLAAEQKWVDAVLHRDGATLEKLMASDIVYTHSSATIQTREQFIKAATSGTTKYTGIDFSDVVVRQFGHTVIITHKAVFKSEQNGESHLFVSEVWAEQGGGWQMVSRQATKLP